VPFEGYTGRYVWHCHLLEHEDNEMMRPFDVVAS
jgi:spore coat protein A, manganese oxidase